MRTSSTQGVGIALVAMAAIAWSTAPLLVLLIPFDSWTILFWRETPLMPLWIWLAFAEVPTGNQLIGAAIVLAAVVADRVRDLRAWESGRPH